MKKASYGYWLAPEKSLVRKDVLRAEFKAGGNLPLVRRIKERKSARKGCAKNTEGGGAKNSVLIGSLGGLTTIRPRKGRDWG